MVDKKRLFSRQDFDALNDPTASLWLRYVIHPVRRPIGLFIANQTNIKPIHLSLFNAAAATIASQFFLTGAWPGFLLGAIIAQAGFIGDSLDGTIAKLKGTGSPTSALMDPICDLWRILVLTVGLSHGIQVNHSSPTLMLWVILLLMVYLADTWIPLTLRSVSRYYHRPQDWTWTRIDEQLIRAMNAMKKHELRLIFYGFNEREALVFFIGPVLGVPYAGLVLGTLIAIPFLFLRARLDLALLKRRILSRND